MASVAVLVSVAAAGHKDVYSVNVSCILTHGGSGVRETGMVQGEYIYSYELQLMHTLHDYPMKYYKILCITFLEED